jgi:hypothetical protein
MNPNTIEYARRLTETIATLKNTKASPNEVRATLGALKNEFDPPPQPMPTPLPENAFLRLCNTLEDATEELSTGPETWAKPVASKFQGINLVIENPKGSVRKGTDPNGNQWATVAPADYGEIPGIEGADGDPLDVYVGPEAGASRVFVIDQVDPVTGKFDEHKAMLGFPSLYEALRIYHLAFSDGKAAARVGDVTPLDMREFRAWIRTGRKELPVGDVHLPTVSGNSKYAERVQNSMRQIVAHVANGNFDAAFKVPVSNPKMATARQAMVNRAWIMNGKACGESHIPDNWKCHVGESEGAEAAAAAPKEATKRDQSPGKNGLLGPNGEESELNGHQWIQARSENFGNWFGDWQGDAASASKALNPNTGEPAVLFHGTTHDFNSFSKDRGNPENDLGVGFYFSNSPGDIDGNYAGEGPDLTQRLELRSEEIQSESYDDEDGELDEEQAMARAREELSGGGAGVMPTYLDIKNPVQLGGDDETKFTLEGGEYDEDTDEESETTGTLVDFADALREVASDYEGIEVEEILMEIMDEARDYGEISASDLVRRVKESEGLMDIYDDNGRTGSGEIVRAAMEAAGFDGFIDHTVNQKFGSERQQGKSMDGMDENTIHYIAFRPDQIKSAIGNNGEFDPKDHDIRNDDEEQKLKNFGVKCGLSFIPQGKTCHVGEAKVEKEAKVKENEKAEDKAEEEQAEEPPTPAPEPKPDPKKMVGDDDKLDSPIEKMVAAKSPDPEAPHLKEHFKEYDEHVEKLANNGKTNGAYKSAHNGIKKVKELFDKGDFAGVLEIDRYPNPKNGPQRTYKKAEKALKAAAQAALDAQSEADDAAVENPLSSITKEAIDSGDTVKITNLLNDCMKAEAAVNDNGLPTSPGMQASINALTDGLMKSSADAKFMLAADLGMGLDDVKYLNAEALQAAIDKKSVTLGSIAAKLEKEAEAYPGSGKAEVMKKQAQAMHAVAAVIYGQKSEAKAKDDAALAVGLGVDPTDFAAMPTSFKLAAADGNKGEIEDLIDMISANGSSIPSSGELKKLATAKAVLDSLVKTSNEDMEGFALKSPFLVMEDMYDPILSSQMHPAVKMALEANDLVSAQTASNQGNNNSPFEESMAGKKAVNSAIKGIEAGIMEAFPEAVGANVNLSIGQLNAIANRDVPTLIDAIEYLEEADDDDQMPDLDLSAQLNALSGITAKIIAGLENDVAIQKQEDAEEAENIAKEAKARAPKPIELMESVMTHDGDDWTITGGHMGEGTGGVKMKDKTGQEWFVKSQKSNDHAHNEICGDLLYQLAGVPTLNPSLIKKGGKLLTGSKWAKEKPLDEHNQAHLAAAQKYFAVHAWLGNRDAAGNKLENQAFFEGPDGSFQLKNVEAGGAMEYKGMGTPKKGFGHEANEWDSMRDPTQSHNSAKLFGGMSPAALMESAAMLQKVDDASIMNTIMFHGPGAESERKALGEKMVNRKHSLLKKAGLQSDSKPEKVTTTITEDNTIPVDPKSTDENDKLGIESKPVPASLPAPTWYKEEGKQWQVDYNGHIKEIQNFGANGDLAGLKKYAVDYLPKKGLTTSKAAKHFQAMANALENALDNAPSPPVIPAPNKSLLKMFKSSTTLVESFGKAGDLDALKKLKSTLPGYLPALKYHESVVAAVEASQKVTPALTVPAPSKPKKAAKKKAKKVPLFKADATDFPKHLDFNNWNGPGSALHGDQEKNDSNQSKADELLAFAKAGDVESLTSFESGPSSYVDNYKLALTGKLESQKSNHEWNHLPKPEPSVEGHAKNLGAKYAPLKNPKAIVGNEGDVGRYLVTGKMTLNEMSDLKAEQGDWHKGGKKFADESFKYSENYTKGKASSLSPLNVGQHTAQLDKMSVADWKRIEGYTNNHSSYYNNEQQQKMKGSEGMKFASAIHKYAIPLAKDMWVTRQISVNQPGMLQQYKDSAGLILQDAAMSGYSTSAKFSGNVSIHMRTSEDVNGLFVGSKSPKKNRVSGHAYEKEMMFSPGQRVAITESYTASNGHVHLVGTMLPTLKEQCCG